MSDIDNDTWEIICTDLKLYEPPICDFDFQIPSSSSPSASASASPSVSPSPSPSVSLSSVPSLSAVSLVPRSHIPLFKWYPAKERSEPNHAKPLKTGDVGYLEHLSRHLL